MKARILVCLLLIVSLLAPTASYARWMNPSTGRFHTMDSYEGSRREPLSLHKYLYCHGDPINLVDPSGYKSMVEVGVSTTTSMTMQALALSAIAHVYVGYAIYSGAKGIHDSCEMKRVAQNLGVEVEPALYLPDLKNGVDWSNSERKRDPRWGYFAHGTSIGAWGDSSAILATGGGDFGTGFYTYQANIPGMLVAGDKATRTARDRGGVPFILVVKIKQEDLSGMMTTAQDLRGNLSQWTTTVTGHLNNGGQGLSGHPIVIGPVSVQGRGLERGEIPTQKAGWPDQWKWEDVSRLKPAAVIPVFDFFNRKLAL